MYIKPLLHTTSWLRYLAVTLLAMLCSVTGAFADNTFVQVGDSLWTNQLGYSFWGYNVEQQLNPGTVTSSLTTTDTNLKFDFSLYLSKGRLKNADFSISGGENAVLTITAPSGYSFRNVTIYFNEKKSVGNVKPSPSSSSTSVTTNPYHWTGNSNSVSFTITAPNKESQVEAIGFSYAQDVPDFTPWEPILSIRSGVYLGEQDGVTISNPQSGVDYYYKKSDSEINAGDNDAWQNVEGYNGWTPYNGSINIDKTKYVNLVAVNHNYPEKQTYISEYYVITDFPKAATPTFSLENGGVYTGIQQLTLSTTDADVGIYYSITQSETPPDVTDSASWSLYINPLPIEQTCYIHAYANGDEYQMSDIGTIHVTIQSSEKPSPGLVWVDDFTNKNTVTSKEVQFADRNSVSLPVLYNPNNVPVNYVISGDENGVIATIDEFTGAIDIKGPGTVTVNAVYTTTSASSYSSQIASYILTVVDQSAKTLTFRSGPTVLCTYTNPTSNSDIRSFDVPDGVVINLDITGYDANTIIMCAVAENNRRNTYPNYETKDDGTIKNQEEMNSDGTVSELSSFQYLGRGIPIYLSDIKSHSVMLRVRLYDPGNKKKSIAQYIINLKVKDFANRPSTPTADPISYGVKGEGHTILTLSESATLSGEPNATIYAKYSNSRTYTPRVLLGEPNISIGNGKTGVFSTVISPDRLTTAIQVRHNQQWNDSIWDVASDAMTVLYTYTLNRHNVRLEAINNPIRRDLVKDAGNLNVPLDVKCYIDNEAVTTLPSQVKYKFSSSNENVATVSSDGVVTCVGAGSAIISVSTDKVDGTVTPDGNTYIGTQGYDAGLTTFNVYVTDVQHQSLIPPTFSPSTDRDYHAEFKATVVANMQQSDDDALTVGDAYYIVVDDSVNAIDGIDYTDNSNRERIRLHDQTDVLAYGVVRVNRTGTVTIPITHIDGRRMEDDDSYTIYAVTYNPDNTNIYSAVSSVTFNFTQLIVDEPVLVPGTEGVPDIHHSTLYTFVSDSLVITASTTTPQAQVYYTVNDVSSDVDITNGRLYVGSNRIVIKTSAIVRAVAYKEGVYSGVVTYTYRKATPKIDLTRFFGSSFEADTVSQTTDLGTYNVEHEAKVRLDCKADKNQDGNMVWISKFDPNFNQYKIYYTTDGSSPTSHSQVYTGELTFDYSVTIWAFCKDTKTGATGLSSRIIINVSNGTEVWQADSLTCPNNTLTDNIISRRVNNANTSTAPHDITITIGQDGQKWSVNDVVESYKGNRIDNYGTLDIIAQRTSDIKGGSITDADDELGVLYNHAYAQLNDYSKLYNDTANASRKARSMSRGVYESTFKLPSHGTYVKFEPEKDGIVTIWCEQNGGMHYSNGANADDRFYNQFIRKRPAYFVDEQGRSVQASTIDASGMLNPRWNEIDRSALLGMGGEEDGLPQTLFTKAEAQDIYDLYEAAITKSGDDRRLKNLIVTLNDGTHQTAANAPETEIGPDGDHVIDATGYCIPSASYMKYTFPVRAGKTYFFFAVKTKIGISALGFKATEDSDQRQTLTLNEGSASSASANVAKIDAAIADGHTANVTVKRSLTAGKWAAMVLPFSMSATQVINTFGDGTIIQHYYGFDEGSPISYINMAQHDHQMIVAGTPFFICPATTMNEFTVDGVQIEKDTIDRVFDQKNGSDVLMNGTYDFKSDATPLYGFYVQAGRLVQARQHAVDQKATRGWLEGINRSVTAKVGFRNGSDEDVTGITVVNEDANDSHSNIDDNIYSISGMIIGRGESALQSLKPGVYIFHGRKLLIH